METVIEVCKFTVEDIITTSGSILDDLFNNKDKDQSGWTDEELN